MPWKIKRTTNLTDPENPVLALWDETVNVNMWIHLESGFVDVFVGADHPANATIHVTIDSERTPVVKNEQTLAHPSRTDRLVMSTILESLGQDPHSLIGHLFQNRTTHFQKKRRRTPPRSGQRRSEA